MGAAGKCYVRHRGATGVQVRNTIAKKGEYSRYGYMRVLQRTVLGTARNAIMVRTPQ